MSNRYAGKIKVVCQPSMMAFPVRPGDYQPTGASCYDPWALSDPDTSPIETISFTEWTIRCNQRVCHD